jgi:release factor glutamine methyltransferase
MTIHQTLRCSKLSPLDAELILSFVIKKSREYLFTYPEKKLTTTQTAKFDKLTKRRLEGEPIAYIIGKKEFYGLEFKVDKNVLIPRPETELLVEASLQRIRNCELGIANIIDIGTGSGNIIISIIDNIPVKAINKMTFFASDISEKALRVAKINAKRHKVDRHIKFIKSDLLEFASKKDLKGHILIAANLPYVSPKLYKENQKNLLFEPKNALISGEDGLAQYTKLLKQIRKISVMRYALPARNASRSDAGGCVTCLLEISPEQTSLIKQAIQKNFPVAGIKFIKDLSKKNRVVKFNISQKDIFIAS